MLFFITLLFDQKTRQIAKTLCFHGKIQNQLVATFVISCPNLGVFLHRNNSSFIKYKFIIKNVSLKIISNFKVSKI